MECDEFDLIAVGRALLSDANRVSKIQGDDHGSLNAFDAAVFTELV